MPSVDPSEPWPRAEPRAVATAARDVDLWLVPLEAAPHERARLQRLLDGDEAARAARFHDDRHSMHFTVAHGLLREIVGAYAGTAPERLVFGAGARGKPQLVHDAAAALEFNLSHAQHLGLIGVTRGVAIGVDIEVMRPMADMAEIAQRNFAPAEFHEWRQLPAAERMAGFFACWTRKEAVIKATGDGLSMPLHRFVVSVNPSRPARLVAIDGSIAAAAHWTLLSYRPARGVFAAVAVCRPQAVCRRYRLPAAAFDARG
jgi:4'-phosphopantetheinyl transferase